MEPAGELVGFNAKAYIQGWETAMKKKDLGLVLEDVAEDIEFTDGFSPEVQRGKEAYAAAYMGLAEAFDVERFDLRHVIHEGDHAAYLFRVTSRFTGVLPMPDGETLHGTGQRVVFDVANFITLKAGKVVRDDAIVDSASFLQQIGA